MVHKAIEGCHQKHFQSSLAHQEVYYPDPDQKVVGKTTFSVVGKVDDPEFLLLVVNPLLKVSPALLVVKVGISPETPALLMVKVWPLLILVSRVLHPSI